MEARIRWLCFACGLLVHGTASAQGGRWLRSPLVDVADAQVGADRARAEQGLTGAGSVLCLVDTGIDEAAFGEAVLARFDAAGAPLGHPLEARFGGAVGGRASDRRGHGTAMASIALTLAPAARVIVARAFDDDAGGFPDEAVLRAARFCRAIMEGDPDLDPRRLVTLLSLGGHDGAHDGRSAFERALESLADRPIVVAAGNDGRRAVRAGGRLLAGEIAEVPVRVPRPTVDPPRVALSVRAQTAAARLSVDGAALDLRHPGAEHRVGPLHVRLEADAERPEVRRVVLTPGPEAPLDAAEVTLAFEGPGDFDLWLADTRLGTTFLPPALTGPWVNEAARVTVPATAPALIAVGASDAGAPDGIASYSSPGPSAGGALVPDLVAPGGWMDVALSTDLDAGDAENILRGRPPPRDATRVAIRGTSAAAAVVAGALLLALEADPSIGPVARERLVASATDAAWTPTRGWGELDVEALLRDPEPQRPLQAFAGRPLTPADGVLHVGLRGGGVLRARLGDTEVHRALRSGATQLAFPLTRPAVGRPVRVDLWLDGEPLPPLRVPVVLDRTRPVTPGGGCRLAPAGSAGGYGWLALAAVLTGRRRPRRRRRRRPRGRG